MTRSGQVCLPSLPFSQPAKPTQAYAVCETEQWGVDGTNLPLWAPNWMAASVCSISARWDPLSGQRQLSKIQTCSTNRNVGLIRVEEEPSTGGRRTTGASDRWESVLIRPPQHLLCGSVRFELFKGREPGRIGHSVNVSESEQRQA